MSGMGADIWVDSASGDTSITRIVIPAGNDEGTPGCLTGVIDLPAGEHDIYLTLTVLTGTGGFDAANLQVIVGQIVDEPGCISPTIES